MDNGWIKIHRKILDNPIVCKDADHFAIWNYLLLNASHKKMSVLFKGKKIELMPGQFITGRIQIAKFFNISESKVHRVLKMLESEQQIKQQTSNKNRLITICKWHEYQDTAQLNEQQLNNNRTTTEQQLNTNKNIRSKEYIKESNTSITKEKAKRFIPPTQKEVEDYCLERKNGIDAQRFIDFYQSKDWYIGKNKMKDWKASIRTWESKEKAELKKKQGDFLRHDYTDEQSESVLVNFED